eukprot:gene4350-5351_t
MVRVAELSYEEEYEEPAPPPDYDPPVITLKGEPLEEILQNQEYIDPGAALPTALLRENLDTVRRRVYVSDPCAGAGANGEDEKVCSLLEDGDAVCSLGNLCVSVNFDDDEEEAAEATAPTVSLVSASSVRVEQGQAYAACPEGASLSLVCDHGATAMDDLDGVLTEK